MIDESKLQDVHDYIYDEEALEIVSVPADPPLRLEIEVPFSVGPSVYIEVIGPDVERIAVALREIGSEPYLDNLLNNVGDE